ncbi:alkene reductase [Gracilimonas sp. Q87]|uniref:alkene reductase n=1 Tax=Gracilimonas sp. Q87 TaxID=3384766 RepID=UPI0039843FDC
MTKSLKLFKEIELGPLSLRNRVVMAPMTRSRATAEHVPTDMMATYYEQRSGAGLIITEGVAPSPNGVGYPRIPGIYNNEQRDAWKPITEKIHKNAGKIFMQLMHTGRISHKLNMPDGAKIIAPSPVPFTDEKMYTDQEGPQDYPVPEKMTETEIQSTIQEFVDASKRAIQAGFDGVEVHGANGYLIEQFLAPNTNTRDDKYGGSIENRNRFAIEVSKAVADAIGNEKTGIRLSPYGVFSGIEIHDEIDKQYTELTDALNDLGLLYIHIVDHSAMGTPEVPASIKETIKDHFKDGAIILSGGYNNAEEANDDLENDRGDLIAFGRPFISNPDLVYRLKNDISLAEPDQDTFYTPGAEGYVDYPKADEK